MLNSFEFTHFQKSCYNANLNLERLRLKLDTIYIDNVDVNIVTNIVENKFLKECHLVFRI